MEELTQVFSSVSAEVEERKVCVTALCEMLVLSYL